MVTNTGITPTHPVRAIMITPVVTVEAAESLRTVAENLHRHQIGALVVTEADKPAGVVSERDIITALAEGGDPDEVWAVDLIGTRTLWAEPDDSILRLGSLMRQAEVRHIPVRHEEQAIGMVSMRDVLEVLLLAGEA